MLLSELIEILQDYQSEMGEDVDPEVLLMTQQNWPFECFIRGVCSGQEINDAADDEENDDADVEADQVIYLVEGGQKAYGSKRAWEVARS